MNNDAFEKLLGSVKQADAIIKKTAKPSREEKINSPDVKHIRDGIGLSQGDFAAMIGVSVNTIKNWEQKRRSPTGAARVLLIVAEKNPDAIVDAIKQTA